MEEKDRYEYYLGTNSIKDNKTNQICDYVVDLLNQQDKENQQLKQQLAEKDKEIERLNLEFETQEDWQEKWQKLYDETCNLNQDKTSFAIEQLEKVKEKALHFYVNDTPKLTGFYVDVNEIENQINQLTHQHEDK